MPADHLGDPLRAPVLHESVGRQTFRVCFQRGDLSERTPRVASAGRRQRADTVDGGVDRPVPRWSGTPGADSGAGGTGWRLLQAVDGLRRCGPDRGCSSEWSSGRRGQRREPVTCRTATCEHACGDADRAVDGHGDGHCDRHAPSGCTHHSRCCADDGTGRGDVHDAQAGRREPAAGPGQAPEAGVVRHGPAGRVGSGPHPGRRLELAGLAQKPAPGKKVAADTVVVSSSVKLTEDCP